LQLFDGAAVLIAELADGRFPAGRGDREEPARSRSSLAAASGLGGYFHASRCADECFSKPHPQMLEELMAELSVAPERTLMIGDTTHDLLMAKECRRRLPGRGLWRASGGGTGRAAARWPLAGR
jgi:phosphoglycolate phosphatase